MHRKSIRKLKRRINLAGSNTSLIGTSLLMICSIYVLTVAGIQNLNPILVKYITLTCAFFLCIPVVLGILHLIISLKENGDSNGKNV